MNKSYTCVCMLPGLLDVPKYKTAVDPSSTHDKLPGTVNPDTLAALRDECAT